MDGSGAARLLDGLDEGQRHAVSIDAAPLCILAGAGSGKTRVLTRRIAYRIATGGAEASHIMALTFTRKAAGELSSRLRQLGVREQLAAGTFHGIAYAQLRRRWADEGRQAPVLLDRKVRLIASLMPRRSATGGPEAVDIAGEIEWAKARMVTPDSYPEAVTASGRRTPLPATAMADLYSRYEQEKRKRGLVDFDDLLAQCAEAMEEDPGFAAAQRWRFRHLFVDEFQDVNPAQFRLLRGWLGQRPDLCVVGDPNQAIYSWNGADPTLLTRFSSRFTGATVVRLGDNYRSSPEVLAVAGAVLGGREKALAAHRPTGPVPEVRSYATDLDEARGIARAARQARRPGRPWSDVAVLTRTNAQLALLQRALHDVQVPCRVAGGGAFLDQLEVKSALARLSKAPRGQPFASSLADLEADVQSAIAPRDAGSGEDDRDADGGLAAAPAVAERRMHLATLVRLGGEYIRLDDSPSAHGFAAWLRVTVGGEGDGTATDAVELATFHRAKGLEWPVVFLAGLERGFVPIGRANDAASEAEERRLLYVAVTRAEVTLHLSWAERRTFGTRTVPRSPSPYLEAILDACGSMTPDGSTRTASSQARLRREKERLRTLGRPALSPAAALASDADPGVLAALRQWRSEAARASGVPAYVIFHDSTLAAVASSCPTTEAELLGLPGLGPVKASRYGETLLALVAQHRASA